MPELERFPSDADPETIFDALERDGAAIVSGFLDDARVDRLVRDFAPHLRAEAWGNTDSGLPDRFFGLKTKRLHGLPARSAAFPELILEPLLLALCERFLRPHGHDFRVSTGELMALGPGEAPQQLHRDADSWLHFPRPRPEILVSANVALTDFTEHNGATVVVPGSHRWEPDRKPAPDETALAVMPRGSALLYGGNVLHGGGANRAEETRIGLYVGYVLSWLRPLENFLITSGEACLRAALPDARRLLGLTDAGWEVLP